MGPHIQNMFINRWEYLFGWRADDAKLMQCGEGKRKREREKQREVYFQKNVATTNRCSNIQFGNTVNQLIQQYCLQKCCETNGSSNITEANDVNTVGFTTFPKLIFRK